MGLAEKACGLVPRASPGSAQRRDVVLLFANRAVAHSSLRKTMDVQPQSEGLILVRHNQLTDDPNRSLMKDSDRPCLQRFRTRCGCIERTCLAARWISGQNHGKSLSPNLRNQGRFRLGEKRQQVLQRNARRLFGSGRSPSVSRW